MPTSGLVGICIKSAKEILSQSLAKQGIQLGR